MGNQHSRTEAAAVSPTKKLWISAQSGSVEALASRDKLLVFDTNIEATPQFFEFAQMKGHAQPVTSVDLSPEKIGLVLSASSDWTLQLYSVSTGEKIGDRLEEHTREINCAKFSRDGSLFASTANDKTTIVWNTETRRAIVKLVEEEDSMRTLAWSPNGELLAASSYFGQGDFDAKQTIYLWNNSSWQQIAKFEGHSDHGKSLAFFPDSKMLCSNANDETVRLWSVDKAQQVGAEIKGHATWPTALSVSNDANTIASADLDGNILVWTSSSTSWHQKFPPLQGRKCIAELCFTKNNKILISAHCGTCHDEGMLMCWCMETGKPVGEPVSVKVPETFMNCASFSPENNFVAVGFTDGSVKLLHSSKSKLLAQLQLSKPASTLKFMRDGLFVDGESTTPIFQSRWNRRRWVFIIRQFSTRKVKDGMQLWWILERVAIFLCASNEDMK